MRGKKAKLLRGLAGVLKGESATRKYFYVKGTERVRVAEDLLGNKKEVKTATIQLQHCPRLLYKTLKVGYKANHMGLDNAAV